MRGNKTLVFGMMDENNKTASPNREWVDDIIRAVGSKSGRSKPEEVSPKQLAEDGEAGIRLTWLTMVMMTKLTYR